MATDDLPDAYRGLPVHPDHQRFSIISLFHPQRGWQFSLLFGLAFGLESAVVSFNRLPLFGIAMARRCTMSCSASYYDDQLALEFLPDFNVSQLGVQCVFKLLGAPPQPSKAFSPAANRYYLGTSVHTGDCALSAMVRFQPIRSRPHSRFFVCWMRSVNPGSSPATWRAGCEVTLTGCILCVPGLEVSLLALSSPSANKQMLLHFLLRRSIRSKCCVTWLRTTDHVRCPYSIETRLYFGSTATHLLRGAN